MLWSFEKVKNSGWLIIYTRTDIWHSIEIEDVPYVSITPKIWYKLYPRVVFFIIIFTFDTIKNLVTINGLNVCYQ